VLPLLLLARHSLGNRLSPLAAFCLLCFYLEAVLFVARIRIGDGLQVEFMDRQSLYWTAIWGAAALVVIMIEPILRRRLQFARNYQASSVATPDATSENLAQGC